MTPNFSRDQVFAGVREDVAECLGLEPEEITLEANFFHDLGGESIDVLDLGFRSEKRFRIRSPFQRLTDRDAWRFNEDRTLSAESLQRLQSGFPHIDWQTHLSAISLQGIRDVMTINLMVDLLYFAQFDNSPRDTMVT